jgi:hypothetical protein
VVVNQKHHHNSVRFKCRCKRVWQWSRRDIVVAALLDGTFYVWCPCGVCHYKDQANFRGEGKRPKPPNGATKAIGTDARGASTTEP